MIFQYPLLPSEERDERMRLITVSRKPTSKIVPRY